MTDADGLTKTKAFVVLKPGKQADAADAAGFVRDRRAPYKYPRSIEFLSELPKTATGKIQRFRLREREAPPAALKNKQIHPRRQVHEPLPKSSPSPWPCRWPPRCLPRRKRAQAAASA